MSLNTLKTYSATYKWQENAGYLDTRNAQVELWNRPVEFNTRQASVGRAMQELAKGKLDSYLERGGFISVGDVVRLMKTGVDIERLAMGQATDRWEIIVSIVSPMMHDLVRTFEAVNDIEDQHERARQWVERADAILLTYVPEAGKQN